MFGFIMGGVAGLIQANVGLNMVFHNTQWVVALHAHTFLLTGVGTMLFSVLYALVPMLTKLEFRSKALVNAHFWLWIVGSVVMAYAMGMAGARGMLRRTFYEGGQFQSYTLVAVIGGLLVSAGFLAFLVNLVGTLGVRNVLALIVPERWLERQQPAPAQL
jgi:cytochrome c oxidase subunit 1